eukprot:g33211.t1
MITTATPPSTSTLSIYISFHSSIRLHSADVAVAVDQNKAWGPIRASTNAINGAIECRVWNQNAQRRFEFYKKILPIFGVNETPNSAGCQGN